MRYEYFRRWLQKDGLSPVEYEDASHLPPASSVTFPMRFAVVDGATEAFESRRFAMILADQFGALPVYEPRADILDPLWPKACEEWAGSCAAASRQRAGKDVSLSFLDELGMQKGAAAAFCGLFVWSAHWRRGAVWQAFAVGDCCIVHRRGEQFSSFPLTASEQFGQTPELVSSNPCHNRSLSDRVRIARGRYAPGDRFYLMSDALACWFLERAEQGGTPWMTLDRLGDTAPGRFAELVAQERSAGRMKNDDVTMISLSISR